MAKRLIEFRFLSTLSLRRATRIRQRDKFQNSHFYPRSPCGERLLVLRKITITVDISIHALLAESDGWLLCCMIHPHLYFYPRSPCGERLQKRYPAILGNAISIHALLAESDFARAGRFKIVGYFYPRSPCGERPAFDVLAVSALLISIHALLAESDCTMTTTICIASRFLSTLSLRRATRLLTALRTPHHKFLSTLSLRRATKKSRKFWALHPVFLSTLSLRRATFFHCS